MEEIESNEMKDLNELIRIEREELQPELNFIKFLIKSILIFTIFSLIVSLIISIIQSYNFYGGFT